MNSTIRSIQKSLINLYEQDIQDNFSIELFIRNNYPIFEMTMRKIFNEYLKNASLRVFLDYDILDYTDGVPEDLLNKPQVKVSDLTWEFEDIPKNMDLHEPVEKLITELKIPIKVEDFLNYPASSGAIDRFLAEYNTQYQFPLHWEDKPQRTTVILGIQREGDGKQIRFNPIWEKKQQNNFLNWFKDELLPKELKKLLSDIHIDD